MFFPRFIKNSFLILLAFLIIPTVLCAAEGKHAMVVTAHPYATETALRILKKGGNTVDAACAAQWVLNVVEPQSSGLGGGGFFLFYEAREKRVYAFDGRETAPHAAFPEMFLAPDGNPYPYYPDRVTGGLPVGVPGILRLLDHMHSRFGSKKFSFAELFDPAVDLARKGFPISSRLAKILEEEEERLKLFSE
ncbi:MAG: gamma-glutamyltransferase, partial [Candidatus Omnitrophica bacterium]|nr:gamma-glutamyltransferase [Candidatus Omnitrophota bacterium]